MTPPIRTEKRLPLANLEPKEFEDLCLALLAADGHDVRHWGDSGGERGIDLWSTAPDGRRWATQCKRTRLGPTDAETEVRKVLDAPPEPPPEVYLVASSTAISRDTQKRLTEVVEGRFAIVCWGFSELVERLYRHPTLIRRFFGDPWVPRRLAVAAGWQDRDWASAFADDLRGCLPADWTVATAVPPERDALVEMPREADGVVFVLTAEVLADRRVLDLWEGAVLPAVRDGRLRGVALPLDGAPWPPSLEVCERVAVGEGDGYARGLGHLVERLTGEPGRALPSPTAPGKRCPRLPDDLRARVVEWLQPVVERPVTRRALAPALGLHRNALDVFPTPETRASATIALATRDDDPIEGALRLVDVAVEELAEEEGEARLADLRRLRRKIQDLRKATDRRAEPGLLEAWLERVRGEHARLVPVFQQEHELDLLDRVYVELAMAPREAGKAAEFGPDVERRGGGWRLRDLLALDAAEHPEVTGRWVVRGDPGSGKTTLLRHLAAELARSAGQPWVPIFQSLPTLLRSGKSLLERVEDALAATGRRGLGAVLDRAGHAGRLLVLLDGLDEVGDARGDAEALIRDLADRWPESRVVVTTRPIGYRRFSATFREVTLLPLDAENRLRFLARWFGRETAIDDEEKAKAALAQLSAPGLEELAGNPLYLTLMAMLIEAGTSPERRPSALYAQVFEFLLGAKQKGGTVEPIERTPLVRQVLRRLAFAMTEDNRDAEPRPTLGERLYHPDFADLLVQLQQVPRWSRSLDTFLDDLRDRVGILADHDGEGADWRFWHRTFREALAAERLRERYQSVGLEEVLERARTIAGQESRWAEPYALLTGLVDEAEVDALLRALMKANPTLALRALATAQCVGDETLLELLDLAGDVAARASAYERIPAQVGDGDRALRLIDRLRRRTTDGNDLYFLDHACHLVAERWPEEHAEAARRERDRLFDHIPLDETGRHLLDRFRTADGQQKDLWCDCPEGVYPIGSDDHDDEKPRHPVRFVRPYAMAAVTITNAQYALFDPGKPPWRWEGVPEAELAEHPRLDVTWWEAVSFCRWLSRQPGFEGARLPSEEEWEVACRAGSETEYWKGDSEAALAEVGWYEGNDNKRTHRVAEKADNDWGLYDVHGNVWEWTADVWDSERYRGRSPSEPFPVDPAGQPADSAASPRAGRVMRGGGCWSPASRVRSACRSIGSPGGGFVIQGFRVLLPFPRAGRRE